MKAKNKIASIMFGLGIGLSTLIAQAGPYYQCDESRTTFTCLNEESACLASGASYSLCSRFLDACLDSVSRCKRINR